MVPETDRAAEAGAAGVAVSTSPACAGLVASDLDGLYRALAKQLEGIVRLGVRAPQPLIEDACQFAWLGLVHHRSQVRKETALGWLIKTALHEAFRLSGRARREHSLDAELERCCELPAVELRPGPADLCERRERLRGIGSLPRRRQRLLWLYGLGFKYEEIASQAGCSSRTVERELHRARATLRERRADST